VAKKKIRYVFGADVTELERGMKRVEYKLGKMSANAQRFGSAMTRNVTAPLVGLGALAVREAVKFESAFAKVKKSVGGTEAELKAMEKGGRGLMLIDLDAKDTLAGAAAYTRSVKIEGIGRGGKERDETLEIRSLNNARAARGRTRRRTARWSTQSTSTADPTEKKK